MKTKRCLYGLTGLLSLMGLIGVFTEAKSFLAFLAFAVDFEYFFIKSDEMLEEYMNKSASRAFYCGMITVALVCVVCFFAGPKRGKGSADNRPSLRLGGIRRGLCVIYCLLRLQRKMGSGT